MDHNKANSAVLDMVEQLLTAAATAAEYAVTGAAGRNIGATDVAALLADKFNCPLPLAQGVVSFWVNHHEVITTKKGPGGGIVLRSAAAAKSKDDTKAAKAARVLPTIPGLSGDTVAVATATSGDVSDTDEDAGDLSEDSDSDNSPSDE